MSIVLVDAPGIDVALVGAGSPQSVQIVITGLTPGMAFEVTGTAAGSTWKVRGGTGATPGSTVILTDAAAALNTPIVYTVLVGGVAFTSVPITVPYPAGRYVLQSLDGRTVIAVERWQDNGDPRDLRLRSHTSDVPGRGTPVVRWDVAAGETGELRLRLARAATEALRTYLLTQGPVLLLRTDGQIRDVPAVQYLLIQSAKRVLWAGQGGASTDRVWTLRVEYIDDPEPTTILPTATWADFNAVYAGATWADFNAEWAGSTWADFNREDWTTR